MISRSGVGAWVVWAAGALAMGCSDDGGGDTIVGLGSFATDRFPGSQIADNNVADDGKAFTNQNQHKDNAFLNVSWNYANGRALALYQLRDASQSNYLVYGSYFDGARWHTPVQLRGRRGGAVEDPTQLAEELQVLWINAAGNSAFAAQDGMAIIVFVRPDAEPVIPVGATVHEDGNRRVWATTFRPSLATAPASGTVVGGFDTEALALDTDNTFNTPTQDPNVETVGFVSDSLHGTHEFENGNPGGVDSGDYAATTSGDPTTFASVIFAKEAGSGASAVGRRWFSVEVDLAASDTDLTSVFPAPASELSSSTGALAAGEVALGSATVHDRMMFWGTFDSNGDISVTVSEFDEAGAGDTATLGDDVDGANSTADSVSTPRGWHVFGPDHGLAAFYVFFTQEGFATDASQDDGEAAEDRDLMVAQIDADAALAVQRLKLDAFDDAVALVTNPLRSERDVGQFASDFDTRINRTAEYIAVLYSQAGTDADTDANGDPQEQNTVLYVNAVQTRVRAASGATPARDLDEAVFDADGTTPNAQGLAVPMQTASGDTGGSNDRADLGDYAFQQELVTGYHFAVNGGSGGDPRCGVQSNAYRMNFIYRQRDDPNTANDDIDRLLVNGIRVTPGATTATTADPVDVELVSASEEVVATQDVDWGGPFDTTGQAFAVDAGDLTRDATGAPTAESGRPLVFFALHSANTPNGEDGSTGSWLERRGYVWDEVDGAVLLSTGLVDEATTDLDEFEFFRDSITAGPESTATHYAGTTLHVFWTEERGTSGSLQTNGAGPRRLMTRSYSKTALNDGSTANDALADRFTPNLEGGAAEAEPVAIDNPTDGALLDGIFFLAKEGNTVGVYFDEDLHIYYQETSTDALGHIEESGVRAPQLVDNDSSTGIRVVTWTVFFPPGCDQLSKSIVVFSRDDPAQGGASAGNPATRLYVRVHD